VLVYSRKEPNKASSVAVAVQERVEGNEWTRPSQASVNLFKLGFFSSFNASLEVSVVHRVLRAAVVYENLCKSTLYCGKNFKSQTCDYCGTEGVCKNVLWALDWLPGRVEPHSLTRKVLVGLDERWL